MLGSPHVPILFILDRSYASFAIALVSDADDELLELLATQGGKIDNVTGPAIAFLVLINAATMNGAPSRFVRPPGVDVLATENYIQAARAWLPRRTDL